MERLDESFVFASIRPREPDSHKGSYGHVLLAAGSRRYRGAANLAAEGALRAGAGIVTLAAVEPVIAAAAARLPECCLLPCPEGPDGGLGAAAADSLLAARQKASVLLMGPGMGNTPDTRALVRALAATAATQSSSRTFPSSGSSLVRALAAGAACTVVLDADALNAAAAMLAAGEPLPRPAAGFELILTPHPGEMARLTGLAPAEIAADRPGVAARYAEMWGCTVVLKGHRTLIAAPDGRLWQNTTGNAGLARGGSGDVLAGMTAGLAACGLPAPEAAACAVWLHGAAADRCARRLGQYGMLPHDLLADLGAIFAENYR